MMADGPEMAPERYNRLCKAEKRLEAYDKRSLEKGDGKRTLAVASLRMRLARILDTAKLDGIDPVERFTD
jgi:hypothetical protein